MDFLWSPWRYAYVSSTTDSGKCVFCIGELSDDDTERLVLYRARFNFIIMNLYPYTAGHLMVVEDDPAVLTLSVTLLRDLGYEILEAADAISALRALETSSRINLLFTDVVLPGAMNGPDLAIEIQRRRPGIGVLFTSGYTDNAIVHQGQLDEEVELLNKPFTKADLARKIRAVLDK